MRLADEMLDPMVNAIAKWTRDVVFDQRVYPLREDDYMRDLFDQEGRVRSGERAVLVILVDGMPRSGDKEYRKFKAYCLTQGVVSQFLNKKVQLKMARQRPMVCATVAAQIMAKLGVAVWYSSPREHKDDQNTLYIGVDVCHKSRKVCPLF